MMPTPPQSGPQEPKFLASLEWPGDVRELPTTDGAWSWFIAVAVGVVVWWYRRARRPVGVAVAAASPAVAAPTAVAKRRALAPPADAASFPAFCAQLKALLRQHCRERFGLVAETRTSEELWRSVPSPAAPTALQPCLQACDLVLFAAAATTTAQLAQRAAEAVAFAEATSAEGAA